MAMLFSAGISTGFLFHSFAIPFLRLYCTPPAKNAGTRNYEKQSPETAIFPGLRQVTERSTKICATGKRQTVAFVRY